MTIWIKQGNDMSMTEYDIAAAEDELSRLINKS